MTVKEHYEITREMNKEMIQLKPWDELNVFQKDRIITEYHTFIRKLTEGINYLAKREGSSNG